jgi:hypothetical protein
MTVWMTELMENRGQLGEEKGQGENSSKKVSASHQLLCKRVSRASKTDGN